MNDNSCVDRVNTEGGRDPASRLTQIRGGNKQHRQRQTRKSRKGWESGETEADALLSLPMEKMRTCQRECLAAETTADEDARLQQISELQKGYHAAESATERDIRLQQIVPVSVIGSWIYPWKRCQVWMWQQDMGNNKQFSCHCLFSSSVPSKPRCINPMQGWLHWIYISVLC